MDFIDLLIMIEARVDKLKPQIQTQEIPDCRIPLTTANDLYANKQALIDSAKRFV